MPGRASSSQATIKRDSQALMRWSSDRQLLEIVEHGML
jgi:hypothetical protein